MTHLHHFAKQYLHENGCKIYINNKQVLVYKGQPNYINKMVSPSISVGDDFLEEDEMENVQTISHDELKKYGFCITQKKVTEETRWRKMQRVMFYINPLGGNTVPVENLKFIKIELNVKKMCVRLVGDNAGNRDGSQTGIGASDWKYINKEEEIKSQAKKYEHYADYLRAVRRGTVEDNVKQFVYLINKKTKDMPVMILNNNRLLCLENKEDMPTILFVGRRQSSKSWGTNEIQSRYFWELGYKVGWISDTLNQFHSLNLTSEHGKSLTQLREFPRAMPSVNLYMACPEVVFNHDDIDFMNVISFIEFLSKYEFYTYKTRWQLGESTKYLAEIKNILATSKNIDDFYDNFKANVPLDSKTKEKVANKVKQIFIKIFNEKFTDNLYDDITVGHEWVLKKPDGTEFRNIPFIVCLEAGLVPVLNTSFAKHKTYLRNALADILSKVVAYQKYKKQMGESCKLLLVADEIGELLGKEEDNLKKTLTMDIFKQGRFVDIGFIGNNQEFKCLPDGMRNNTSHLFCGLMEDSEEVNKIKHNYNLRPEQAEQLMKLDMNKHEMACLTKEDMVVYEKDGRRKVVREYMYRGKLLAPLCKHLRPSEKV